MTAPETFAHSRWARTLYPPLVPIAKVIRLDDDGAIALPIADPSKVSFAIVEPPYEPAALAVAAETAGEPR